MRDVRVLLIVARVWIFTTIVTLLFTSNYDQVEAKERIYLKSSPNVSNKKFFGASIQLEDSKAPISQVVSFPSGRLTPRWSVMIPLTRQAARGI
jgi:hypothetical protein